MGLMGGPEGTFRERVQPEDLTALMAAVAGDPRLVDRLQQLVAEWAHLAEAQRVAAVGSFDLDPGAGVFQASEEMDRLYGSNGDGCPPPWTCTSSRCSPRTGRVPATGSSGSARAASGACAKGFHLARPQPAAHIHHILTTERQSPDPPPSGSGTSERLLSAFGERDPPSR